MSTKMHAFLFTNQDKQKREEKAQEFIQQKGITDILTLVPEKGKHYIANIRQLIKNLTIAPFNPTLGRAVIIYDAHFLTSEAANSFLKTLEEPQGNTIIILTAPNQDLVLDTIASRAQHIEVIEKKLSSNSKVDFSFLDETLGSRFKKLEKIKDREEGIKFCENLILELRQKLIGEPGDYQKILKQLENVIQAKKDLEANVNLKIALGDLFIVLE